MRPASLFLAFALAKAAGLIGHPVPLSAWAVIAYLWQDALVVLAFTAIDPWLEPFSPGCSSHQPASDRRPRGPDAAGRSTAVRTALVKRQRISWTIYAMLALYAAVNIPV